MKKIKTSGQEIKTVPKFDPGLSVCANCKHFRTGLDGTPTGFTLSTPPVAVFDCYRKGTLVQADDVLDCFDPKDEMYADDYGGDMVQRHAGVVLTGIEELKDSRVGESAVICGSGTTLRDMDPGLIPRKWPVVAINEAIGKLADRATYWVMSDTPIVNEYAHMCPDKVTILAMHDATSVIERVKPKNKVYTVESQAAAKQFDDGINFFSRGTVLIGAIEMLRYMGVKRFYCFGLDCYRTADSYYYDNRKPVTVSELKFSKKEEVCGDLPRGVRIWVTSRLRRMVTKLDEAKESGIWSGVELFCVGSKFSQQTAIPKMSAQEFVEDVSRVEKIRRRERRQSAKLARAQSEFGGSEHDLQGDSHASGSPDSSVVGGAGNEPPSPEVGSGSDAVDPGVAGGGDAPRADDQGDSRIPDQVENPGELGDDRHPSSEH